MYTQTIDHFAEDVAFKISTITTSQISCFIGAMMVVADIGFGDTLMFAVGTHVPTAYAHLIMGAVFACGLTIVVFAGSNLFTGTAMYLPFAALRRSSGIGGLLLVWGVSWRGNFVGAVVLAMLIHPSGEGVALTDGATTFFAVVEGKLNGSPTELISKGVLWNWLVCVAMWMAARTKSDAAKLVLIFWPVFAFVACGFEHSVVNMFLFALALIGPPRKRDVGARGCQNGLCDDWKPGWRQRVHEPRLLAAGSSQQPLAIPDGSARQRRRRPKTPEPWPEANSTRRQVDGRFVGRVVMRSRARDCLCLLAGLP
ncbi:formate/nitrite transporter family protein [Paraburkholderia sp. RL17-337-BIB-A]|uniref:formate/nitrite transporter family protein n=1 Tax=Paraburkholderia sp. RL17-337-BIB-A TaxID=3031636 RepID=UPI0038BBBF61